MNEAQMEQDDAIAAYLKTPERPVAKSRARVRKVLKQAEAEASRKASSGSSSAAGRRSAPALPGSLEAAYPGVSEETLYRMAENFGF